MFSLCLKDRPSFFLPVSVPVAIVVIRPSQTLSLSEEARIERSVSFEVLDASEGSNPIYPKEILILITKELMSLNFCSSIQKCD